MRSLAAITIALLTTTGLAGAAEVLSVRDAILQAVTSNPGVGEAAANRRATETELRQVQSTLLPQVRLEARVGPEKFNHRDVIVPPLGNDTWQNGRSGTIFVRQLLFDGFTSLNEIWRQAARVDAAAYRTHERTELIALDAAEAYIDVARYIRLVALSQENVAAHRRIFDNVNTRFQGGRAGEGDLEQAKERVAAAEAALFEFRRSLDEARAKFRKTVGIEPINLRFPGRLPALPKSKDEALAVTLRHNPTIQAAQSDADAAKYAFHATTGAFMPTLALEGRATAAKDTDTIFGRRDEVSGKLVATWDVFRGGQDLWRRSEMAERFTEQGMRHARLQRDAFESIDKAWAARTITIDRVAALTRQIEADRKVIIAYGKEYELGQRSLIDLLNAQNQLFNGLVQLESSRSLLVFADYQLLAAMGQVLSYLKTTRPVDSEPLEVKPVLLFPTKLPPIIVDLPQPGGPEPINIGNRVPPTQGSLMAPPPRAITVGQRWPSYTGYTVALDSQTPARWSLTSAPAAQPASGTSGSALSYAAEMMQVPLWPIKPRAE
jgi:outer membrane protein, adhesin transport system